ncbi:restriction endonuclease [Actinomadura violacea]|uniref:DEAD/DEAH box helicase family protein n=1 Tax=Actinomadura violacea TaxID=2819934 RepID=A0ABS3SCM9_9ACTN|nr:DEAD/DEAH box helicase family protein [Actinomadura violacea]MBO2466000.1 DEAD/DEAH box helicase family protein [Actinomadura violacea]
MKFRFDDQPHQSAAVSAVVDLFEGALVPPRDALAGQAPGAEGHADFWLEREILADNLAAVTARESVTVQRELQLLSETDLLGMEQSFPNFSVEMETGTGKTYVYISTALRLAEQYGLRKFVILVHSIAIRAGVVKTFEQTEEHFRAKYSNVPYTWGVLGENSALSDFAEPSSTVQFLVASVQSLDKPETNTLYASAEQPQLWGDDLTGVQQIAKTRPVVLIDEPQNMATPLRRQAIATLNPLVALRYSATHKEPFNLVHRLGPKQASEAGLVKRVSVKGIVAGEDGKPYVRLDKLRSVRRRLMGEAVIDHATADGARRGTVVLQNGTDLFEESGGLPQYRGLVIESMERKPDRIVFENGLTVKVGQETGVDHLAVWRDQIRHTIRQHLTRQRQIDTMGRDVKVLSLFFVEHVADYAGADAPLPGMFDELYREEWLRAGNAIEDMTEPGELRVAYFPSTKTGILKDTAGRATDAEYEARAYREIIANKELILDRANPRAFIFSHSALKEGWDNPNVFQVGFLRHTRSELERRQQIGRGLRLPVDQTGRRIMDPSMNRLTLIVDESFTEFRDGLNAEYVASGSADGDGEPGPELENADTEVIVRRRPALFNSPEFAELWKRIRYKARYRVSIAPNTLVTAVAASEHLEDLAFIERRANVVQTADLIYDDTGQVITADAAVAESRGERIVIAGQQLPDVVQLIEDQLQYGKFPLQLTRPTIASIVRAILTNSRKDYAQHVLDDPDRWARIVAGAIRIETIGQMVQGITYEPMDEESWWDAEVVFLEVESKNPPQPMPGNPDPQSGVAPAPDDGVNLFDHVDYDSHVERAFAAQLENDREHVKLFAKLPRRFKVRTPVGEYSPDWAIVYDEDGLHRLYLVRETKGTRNLADLEWDEAMRIRFARRHFAVGPEGAISYEHTTDTHGLLIGDTVDDIAQG